jgi:putative flippase GtrA
LNSRVDITAIRQFIKYSFAGVFNTAFYAILYFAMTQINTHPMIAHFIAYAISVVVGFFINRHWTFRGFGGEKTILASGLQFGAVSLLGFSLNTVFVWLLTGPVFNGPSWWPLVPIMFVTPFVTFAFNRKWSFS